MSSKKIVTLYRNGTTTDPLKTALPDDLETLLKIFSTEAKRLFLQDGTEVLNLAQVQDKHVLYVSEHEDFISPRPQSNSNWVTLNVGGKVFTTTKRTLTMTEPSSMLARMFCEEGFLTPSNQDNNGAFLIDRSPLYFEPILNYLRCGQLVYDKHLNPEGILEEARFFGVQSIIPVLEQIIMQEKVNCDQVPLTRRDVVDAIIKTSAQTELRFQGVNLSGADLSRLDLRNINFKYANMQGCNLMGTNLSWCCLERADLTNANLDNAQLLGVKSLCANMSGVSMKNSNFRDPGGNRANMEGVNLSAANLEGSYMFGVNLRVANLKKANLKNCDLRAAVLAGANLELCDLSGSDLHEANLRGANLKDAAFELMLTPLHMSQTIP